MILDGTRIPTVIFCCVHKGASTFVSGVLARAAVQIFSGLKHIPCGAALKRGHTLEDLALPPCGAMATRVYPYLFDQLLEDPEPAQGRYADKKLVVMRRDPRDVAVSWYHSYAVSHPVPPAGYAERFLETREKLRTMSVRDGIAEVTAQPAINEFRAATKLLETYPWAIDLPYELLVTDCRMWFARLVEYLEWPPALVKYLGPALAQEVAPPAREDPTAHKRRIRPGNWLEVFDDALVERFQEAVGPEMAAAGYGVETLAA